ncbi:MAG: DUF2341 domain-containing protein [Deltaproteobacteria bacterium]|nr:DUF2341 domain-containing protein [Deltaproteobacteria bacterium]
MNRKSLSILAVSLFVVLLATLVIVPSDTTQALSSSIELNELDKTDKLFPTIPQLSLTFNAKLYSIAGILTAFLDDFFADSFSHSPIMLADSGDPTQISVHVYTDKGRDLEGVRVYAFTESGSYTGQNIISDASGLAVFDASSFSDGTHKFRADYMNSQFWSNVITLPGTYNADVQIAEETTTVQVIQSASPKESVNVYLFTGTGTYLGQYETTDANGEVTFDIPADKDFKFRADVMGAQYFSDVITIVSGGSNSSLIDCGGGALTVTVGKGEGTPLEGTRVYLYTAQGSYLGLSEYTDNQGNAIFNVSSGAYKIRADYFGYQFWSQEIDLDTDESLALSIPHQDVTITIQRDDNNSPESGEDIDVYLFSGSEAYQGIVTTADAQGQVVFNLPQQEYKVRADYLSQQFWSDVFNWADTTVTINEGEAEITVTNIGQPVSGIEVYAYGSSGTYLGLNKTTDAQGKVSFRLPASDYNFRADYMSGQYWSGVTTVIEHTNNPITISTGGGNFTLTLLKGPALPIEGVDCYLFTESGSYLGEHMVTSNQGEVDFALADGSYKIRMDYMGYQFWTDVFEIPTDSVMAHTLSHQDVTITVQRNYNGDIETTENIKMYLFTPAGSYLGENLYTDAQGQVTFNLPEMAYKVRGDYLSQQYWSDVFNATDKTITINEGIAEIHVNQGASPVEGINVYVFTSSGSYLGIVNQTDENGMVSFRLPEGDYRFRGDYQSNQYWATETVTAHQINTINLNTGGGPFTLRVEKVPDNPMIDIPVYVFSAAGSYLGINARTDDQGQVAFDLSDGDYKFRADYLGYQFWTDTSTVPTTLEDVLTIPHQDVAITVNEVYGAVVNPLSNTTVYLFASSGSYMGVNKATDAQGQVTFNLPEMEYKVRADYMSGQYWSDPFIWQNKNVDINHGTANLHVMSGGDDLSSAKVYLFSETGSYLGRYETTDTGGNVSFLVPARNYKFRVDHDGSQYWTKAVNITAHQQNSIDFDINPPTEPVIGSFTADPVSIVSGGSSALQWTTVNADTVSIDNGVGNIALSGSISVSPSVTTTYTLTANGPGGTSTASVTVTATQPQPTISISAEPSSVMIGNASTLTWSSTNSTSVSIDNGIGNVALDGTMDVTPTETTTYTITANGPGGTDTSSTTVTITYPQPTVGVSAVPDSIMLGATTTLTWSSTDADTAVIDNDIGSVDPNGSISVSPSEDTTYTIMVTGPGGGTATSTVTVTVTLPPPTVGISADPEVIKIGESTALTWNTTYSDSVVIDNGIGNVGLNGSLFVSPEETTIYTIMVTGPGGTATSSVTITVTDYDLDKYITAIIDHTKIDDDLTDFPVLIKLSGDSGANGYDATPLFDQDISNVEGDGVFDGNNGDMPDISKWISNGYPNYLKIQNNKLNIKSDTTDIHNLVQSDHSFWLRGNFDIQVDFDVVALSNSKGGFGYLGVYTVEGYNSRIQREYHPDFGGQCYRHYSYNGTSFNEGYTTGDDVSGKMRITRIGSTFITYAWFNGQWNQIAAGTNFTSSDDVYVRIGVYTHTDQPYTEMNFDNFQVNSGDVIDKASPRKIAVYTSDNKQCYTEIEKWDYKNKNAWLWVKVPEISSTEDTHLKVYYDKDMSDQYYRKEKQADDSFDGADNSKPDTDLWEQTGNQSYSKIMSNKLNVRANSTNTSNAVRSKNAFWIKGDFDIQVDFEVVAGPEAQRWMGYLGVYTEEGHFSRIVREYLSDSGQRYRHNSYNGASWQSEGELHRNDDSGKMRITRVGSTFITYAWFNDQWNQIGTSYYFNTNADLYIEICVKSIDDLPYVEMNFDNFQVNYAESITGYVGGIGSVAGQKVWDSNFRGVWHLSQTPAGSGSILDSTSYDNNGRSYNMGSGNVVDVAAGKGLYFNGIDERIAFTDVTDHEIRGDISIEYCVKTPSTLDTIRGVAHCGYGDDTATNFDYSFNISSNGTIGTFIEYGSGVNQSTYTANSYISTNNQYYIAFNRDVSEKDAIFFVNGILKETRGYAENPTGGTNANLSFSVQDKKGNPENYSKSNLREIRISTITRSPAWIKATYFSNYDDLISYTLSPTLDSDNDGISDNDEINIYGTNPYNADTDGDGINDSDELAYWGESWNQDIDGDGIVNLLDDDSDNDGFSDGMEIAMGYDPGDPNSTPPPLPDITFSANPGSIDSGQSSTLQWSTVNADSVSLDNGIGSVALSGSVMDRFCYSHEYQYCS